MTDDKTPLKSSYELAMERFRKSDKEAGVERQPPTEAQKTAIAEIRSIYQAKIAELEILHSDRVRQTMDPSEQAVLADEHRRERARLTSQRDEKIDKARQDPEPEGSPR
jgi:hypothetical protein